MVLDDGRLGGVLGVEARVEDAHQALVAARVQVAAGGSAGQRGTIEEEEEEGEGAERTHWPSGEKMRRARPSACGLMTSLLGSAAMLCRDEELAPRREGDEGEAGRGQRWWLGGLERDALWRL